MLTADSITALAAGAGLDVDDPAVQRFVAGVVKLSASTPPVVTDASQGSSQWPQIITVQGVHIKAFAPINPMWQPSMMAHMAGSQPGSFVFEPSNGMNASPPAPLRSPAGFPLVYNIVAGHVVGTPTLLYGETAMFNSDSELYDYQRRDAERTANLNQWAANFGQLGSDIPIIPPDQVAATLALFDAEPNEAIKWFHLSNNEQFALINRGMTMAQTLQMLSRYNGGPAPAGWDLSKWPNRH